VSRLFAASQALAIAHNGALPLAAAPEWLQLLPAGPHIEGRDGREWNLPDAQALVAAQNRLGHALVLDWEHASEREFERAPAAGWIEELQARGDGTLWGRMKWTPQGEDDVRTGAYRYISPVFTFEKLTRRIVQLRGAGLVHEPNLPLAALNRAAQSPETTSMDLSKVYSALGLVGGANEEQILAAVNKLQADVQTAVNKAEQPDLARYVPRADYDQVMARAANAERAVKTAKDEAVAAEAEALIVQAQKDGKIAPASAGFYRATCKTADGVERFKAFVAAAPAIVADVTEAFRGNPPPGDKKLGEDELAICRQMGLDPEDYKKSKEA